MVVRCRVVEQLPSKYKILSLNSVSTAGSMDGTLLPQNEEKTKHKNFKNLQFGKEKEYV
jgi:hypothetical protein